MGDEPVAGFGPVDAIINSLLDRVGVSQDHIDKATEVIDMISFTKENGKDIIVVKIGSNIEIKITK
jgi:hypothetical protein